MRHLRPARNSAAQSAFMENTLPLETNNQRHRDREAGQNRGSLATPVMGSADIDRETLRRLRHGPGRAGTRPSGRRPDVEPQNAPQRVCPQPAGVVSVSPPSGAAGTMRPRAKMSSQSPGARWDVRPALTPPRAIESYSPRHSPEAPDDAPDPLPVRASARGRTRGGGRIDETRLQAPGRAGEEGLDRLAGAGGHAPPDRRRLEAPQVRRHH